MWPAFLDAMAQMDRRVKSGGSALLAVKETQATGVPMVILEMLVNVVFQELTERREILVVLEDQVHLAQQEMLDQRVNGEVPDLLGLLDRKETLDYLEQREPEASQGEEEIMGQRVHKDLMGLKEKRGKWGLRAQEDFQVKWEPKA